MRCEQEMMGLILRVAKEDERVHAVYMNGSRTNPNAPKDILQDYDIVYVVEETASFIADPDWIRCFGEILFMQFPDEHPIYPSDKEHSYGYLMIFTDGNRLDLTVMTVDRAKENVLEDKLCIILLDKDGILPEIPASTDESHRVTPPSKELFAATCNEFWWCLNNVAKGLWRNEPTYAQDMINKVVRDELLHMLAWKAGILNDYTISIGKSGKYLPRWISEEEWQRYLKTFSSADIEEMWKAVFIMCDLFSETAKFVAERSGFSYNQKEEDGCRLYLKAVQKMPSDSTDLGIN